MRVADAAEGFHDFARAAGVDIGTADVDVVVAVMVDWYVHERVDDVDLSADGDMLLVQWGTYDWGSEPSFQYDITRQLIDENDPDDDGAIWQLSVRAHYAEGLGAGIGSGNRWCSSPNDAPAFKAFIGSCAATRVVNGKAPVRVDVRYEQAG